jgi:hypothetical protein
LKLSSCLEFIFLLIYQVAIKNENTKGTCSVLLLLIDEQKDEAATSKDDSKYDRVLGKACGQCELGNV